MRSAIILAGGSSKRMNGDKGQLLLGGVPVIRHAYNRLSERVDEVIVVVHTQEQIVNYRHILGDAEIVVDKGQGSSPILGASTGLMYAQGDYTFMSGHDMPFINLEIVDKLFTLAENHDGATPLWPNGFIEPLHAVYNIKNALVTARRLLENGEKRLRMILHTLPDVKFLTIEEIKSIDRDLITLFDIDDEEDFIEARRIWKKQSPKDS